MLYAVLFEDDNEHAEQRARYMSQHLDFLQRNGAQIQAAGPLREASDGAPAGGLWLVNADSQQQLQALIEADPLWPLGVWSEN